jgi:hypothetical protein
MTPGIDLGELRATTPLPSLIGRHVKLHRRNKLWVGCCPFHVEKTPSFYVYDDHYHCFGCWAHGDAIEFVRRIEGLTFGEAVTRFDLDPAPRRVPRASTQPRATSTSNYAARLAAEKQPIAGTLAESYLREGRGLGDLPLPGEAGFHPAVWSAETKSKHPALIVPCVEDGRTVRVQAILLDPATGGKAAVSSPKLTFGAGYSHVPATFAARLRGEWTMLTEGPEDGITLNAVVGWRADASLGSGSLDKPRYPPGTRLLIIGDNGVTAERQAETAAATHRARGADVRVVFPPSGVKDANDLLRAQGPDVVRAWIVTAMQTPNATVKAGLPTYYPAPMEDGDAALARQRASIERTLRDGARLAAARREVMTRRAATLAQMGETTPGQRGAVTRRIIREVAGERGYGTRLPRPARHLITGSQASGKTTTAYQTIASLGSPLVVRLFEPTLEKAEEIANDYRKGATAASLPVMVVRGRSAIDPRRPEHRMCDRSEAADAVARDGRSVIEHLCRGCKFATDCGDQRQRATIASMAASGGGFFVSATAGLFLPSAIPSTDIMIVDERATIEAAEAVRVAASSLDPFGISGIGIDTRDTMHTLRAAVHHPAPLQMLRDARIDRAELRNATKALDTALAAATPEIDGSMADREIIDRIEGSARGHIRSALTVVAAVRREIDQPRETLTAVQVRDDEIVVSRLCRPVGMRHATVLLLDGTGNEALNQCVFGTHLTHERIAIERRIYITGTRGRVYSRQSITGRRADGSEIENRQEKSAKLRHEIMQVVDSQPGTLLVASKRAIEALLDPSNDRPAAHYGALRGKNKHEHQRRVVEVGPESMSIRDLEDIARAFIADDPQPFVSMDAPAPPNWGYRYWPYKATQMRRMRDGSLSPVEVEVHPDPRCQRVLEQIREAELVQGIDRVRPIFNIREGVLMNELCLDVTYDEICTHRELLRGGNPLQRAYLASGILPLGAKYLHAAHPGQFPTEKAAARMLEKYPPNVNRNVIYRPGVFVFRAEGQRGRDSRAIIDLARHADPRAALTAVIGQLALFAAVSQTRLCPGVVPMDEAVRLFTAQP